MASILGSFKSSISSSCSGASGSNSASSNDKGCIIFNQPFHVAIASTAYKPILNVPLDYDIYLDSSGYHWFVLVKANMEGSSFPYVTLEITTDSSLTPLIPTMRVSQPDNIEEPSHGAPGKPRILGPVVATATGVVVGATLGALEGPVEGVAGAMLGVHLGLALAEAQGGVQAIMLHFGGTKKTKVGSTNTSIAKLCTMAEQIRLGMGKYSLVWNNCQHFCNNVLSKLGLPTQPPTVGPETTAVEGMDNIHNIFTVAQPDSGQDGGTNE